MKFFISFKHERPKEIYCPYDEEYKRNNRKSVKKLIELTVLKLYARTIVYFDFILCVCLGTPETAFVNAISSAGVIHEVTSECDMGVLENCNCQGAGVREKKINMDDPKKWFYWSYCNSHIKVRTIKTSCN